jgi:Zn-dependent peptidase ImmA (M78 family)/transcriptional regulator with XRE-family HTH domain
VSASNTVNPTVFVGTRVRQLRLALGLTQADLAAQTGLASGSISMIENGHHEADIAMLKSLAEALDCAPSYLVTVTAGADYDRPKLRAYADASQRAVDRTLFDTITAVEAIRATGLRPLPVKLPVYDGDLNDDDGIDRIAADVRTAAGIEPDSVIPNVIRAAERLGCVVLPLDRELGRHWGMSLTVDGIPVIRVARPSHDPESDIPGDRQRFTVAHELGHLVLHSGSAQPATPSEAAKMEREANRFAASFLVPGDVALEDLNSNGGRITLSTLAAMKQKWGYSVKAFVFRFRELGVIDDAQARSLYKQISARRWNKEEPHRPGNESAVWFAKALREGFSGSEGTKTAAAAAGLGERYIARWVDWSPSGSPALAARISQLKPRQNPAGQSDQTAQVSRLPRRP